MFAVHVWVTLMWLLAPGYLERPGKPLARQTVSASNLAVALRPDATIYTSDEAARGAVRFTAEIRNPWNHSVVVAHPMICFPPGRESIRVDDRNQKSEILLLVTRPDGRRVVLRDGPHFFDPASVDHLVIPAKGAQEFAVGWFFENARGRWQNDQVAWRLFSSTGEYAVQIVLRNIWPCSVRGEDKGILVWTGEMRSEPVKVRIR